MRIHLLQQTASFGGFTGGTELLYMIQLRAQLTLDPCTAC
jgi:hypothetical protein